jgi:hypothetical protein
MPGSGDGYAPSTVVHSETVLRRFYDFHRDAGTGPVLNPFPLDASRRGRIPRAILDDWFNRLFAALPSACSPTTPASPGRARPPAPGAGL